MPPALLGAWGQGKNQLPYSTVQNGIFAGISNVVTRSTAAVKMKWTCTARKYSAWHGHEFWLLARARCPYNHSLDTSFKSSD